MKINISNIRKSRLTKVAPFLVLDLMTEGCFLAGGSIRSLVADEEVADFDVFFKEQPVFETIVEADAQNILVTSADTEVLRTYSQVVKNVRRILEIEKFKLVFACPVGKLFTYVKDGIKIQLILQTWGDPQDVINDFDFNACKAAIDNQFVYIDRSFLKDVKSKVLSIHKITYPAASIKRLVKYSNKGYNIGNACMQMAREISTIVITDDNIRLYID